MKKNKWKLYFFILFGIILGILFFLVFNIINKNEIDNIFKNKILNDEPSFQIKLNKKQTNNLMMHYFNDFEKNSKIKYSFAIENLFVFKGTFEFLNKDLNFYMYFDPLLEDNNVVLKTKNVSIGTLNLPASEILRYVKNEYNFPNWVHIDYKKEIIILNLNNFEEESDFLFNAEKIDLINDEIIINVFLKK